MRLKELATKRRMHEMFKDITVGAKVYDGSHKAHYLSTRDYPDFKMEDFTDFTPPHPAFYYFYYYKGVKRLEWLMWLQMGEGDARGRLMIFTWYVKPPHVVGVLGHEPDWRMYIPVDDEGKPQWTGSYEWGVTPDFKEKIDRERSMKDFKMQMDVKAGLLMWMIDDHNKELAKV